MATKMCKTCPKRAMPRRVAIDGDLQSPHRPHRASRTRAASTSATTAITSASQYTDS